MLARIALPIMRIGTGMLLVIWGLVRVYAGRGEALANKYYGGAGADETLQLVFGCAEVVLGVLVVLGLFRRYTLIGSAVILVGGAIPIWKHFLDPFGLYLFASPDNANILFFPSLTVAGAALALIALRELDSFALDRAFSRKA
ncbi:MAG: hypothetical protein V2I27_06600 [Erythrobacter sp.]|jgi:uncharacterized membrane protein YphA (DoxX/SURF4 family)|nr:hypothetical protein [Erythrobacter sp.]